MSLVVAFPLCLPGLLQGCLHSIVCSCRSSSVSSVSLPPQPLPPRQGSRASQPFRQTVLPFLHHLSLSVPLPEFSVSVYFFVCVCVFLCVCSTAPMHQINISPLLPPSSSRVTLFQNIHCDIAFSLTLVTPENISNLLLVVLAILYQFSTIYENLLMC